MKNGTPISFRGKSGIVTGYQGDSPDRYYFFEEGEREIGATRGSTEHGRLEEFLVLQRERGV